MGNFQWEHRCKLKRKKGPVIHSFVDTGVLIRLRRSLRLSMMLNENHPFCEEKFKSWKIYWEYMICSVFLFYFLILCINSAYSWSIVRRSSHLMLVKASCDVVVTADILKQFVTGFYDNQKNRTVLNKTSIAKKYILTYFVPDVLSCIHTYLLPLRIFDIFERKDSFTPFYEFTRIFAGFRILRLPRMLSTLRIIERKTNMKKIKAKILEALVIQVVIWMWLYYVQFTIENFIEFVTSDRMRWKTVTWDRFYSATLKLMKVSVGDYVDRSSHVGDVIATNHFIVIGWILDIYLMALGLQLWNQYSSGRNRNAVVCKQFMRYVSYKRLSPNLREKFFAFYDFKFRNGIYKERYIYNNASLILKQQIQVYITRDHIASVEFFQLLPENLLMTLSTKLKTEIYLTNDVIVATGDIGVNMYFIRYGTVAIYTPSGKEMYHLDDGAHFGEISILFKERRLGSALAATPCELFVLSMSDFQNLLAPYPEIEEKIKTLALDRYMVLNKVIYDRISKEKSVQL